MTITCIKSKSQILPILCSVYEYGSEVFLCLNLSQHGDSIHTHYRIATNTLATYHFWNNLLDGCIIICVGIGLYTTNQVKIGVIKLTFEIIIVLAQVFFFICTTKAEDFCVSCVSCYIVLLTVFFFCFCFCNHFIVR